MTRLAKAIAMRARNRVSPSGALAAICLRNRTCEAKLFMKRR